MLRSALGVLLALTSAGCFSPPLLLPDEDDRAQTSGFAQPAEESDGAPWSRGSEEDGGDGDATQSGGHGDDDAGDDESGTDGADDGDAETDTGAAPDEREPESDNGTTTGDVRADDEGEAGSSAGTGEADDERGSSGTGERSAGTGEPVVYVASCLLISADEACGPSCRGWETTSVDQHEAESEQCFAAAGVLVSDVPCWSPTLGTCTLQAPDLTVELTYDAEDLGCTADALEDTCEALEGGTWTPA